ncbi:MAG TPA: THUMP domain-containing protein, partial [Rhodocyclaceae bacterium]
MERFFASCPRGLEALLAEDLVGWGASEVRAEGGGVAFAGDWPVCWRANLHSRLATRILCQVAEGAYQKEDDIYRLARAVDWAARFSVDRSIRVAITAVRSPLKSIDFTTLRIKDAVCDRFRQDCGRRPDVDTRAPDVRIHAFLNAERATLYLDTSGEPLYHRGLRQKTVDAPLKENLAAGILRLTGWQPGVALFDP